MILTEVFPQITSVRYMFVSRDSRGLREKIGPYSRLVLEFLESEKHRISAACVKKGEMSRLS